MSSRMNRREFLQTSALAGAGAMLAVEGLTTAAGRAAPRSPNEKLDIAVIGVANRGAANLDGVAGENIVALCDVDENYLAEAAKRFPRAKTYNDFRQMLDKGGIDAVVVSTTDHTHAIATMRALESGRHVYCEKPLTRTVWEARTVAETAKKRRRVTQMGTQIHATDNYRRVVEVIRSGAIGPVREVHHWVGSVWSGGAGRPKPAPVPENLHWDLWLGPAPERPYAPGYHPAAWRGFWDFGGGATGDMGCHHMDLSFWALDLRYPTTIAAEGPAVNAETAPPWLIARYEFPARKDTSGRGEMPPVSLTWYNGDKRPHYFAEGKLPEWGNGSLFVGDKGMLLADYDRYVLLPEKEFSSYQPPAKSIPNSIGHHAEWIQACKTGGPTTCNFDYSGALTEAVLLANVAYRTGKTLEWDPKHLKARNAPEADQFLRAAYRKGWTF